MDAPTPATDAIGRRARIVFVALVVCYLALFGFNVLTRKGRFTPDSFNYIDVARNVLEGRGLSQTSLGYNAVTFSPRDRGPTFFLRQGPMYPLFIAGLGAAGLPLPVAALAISLLAYAATLLAAYLLSRDLYGRRVAFLAVGALTVYFPLRACARAAWSEAACVAFTYVAFWLLATSERRVRLRYSLLMLAGLACGFAFALRYASAVLFVAGLLALVVWRDRAQTLRRFFSYLNGGAPIVVAVLFHNFATCGSLQGPAHTPSEMPLSVNVIYAAKALVGNYLAAGNWLTRSGRWRLVAAQALALGVLTLVVFLVRARGGGVFGWLGRLLFSGMRRVLTLWLVIYVAFLIYSASRINIDTIDYRLMAPGGVALVILLAAYFVQGLAVVRRAAVGLAIVIAALAVTREAVIAVVRPPADIQQVIESSERLTWVAENTTPDDLIIGQDTVDIAFFFDRRMVVSFSPYPYTKRPTYDEVLTYVDHVSNPYETAYLILRDKYRNEKHWKHYLGAFVADIAAGRTERYPRIRLLTKLQDGYVFLIERRETGRGGPAGADDSTNPDETP